MILKQTVQNYEIIIIDYTLKIIRFIYNRNALKSLSIFYGVLTSGVHSYSLWGGVELLGGEKSSQNIFFSLLIACRKSYRKMAKCNVLQVWLKPVLFQRNIELKASMRVTDLISSCNERH